jgi:hypothetical protein
MSVFPCYFQSRSSEYYPTGVQSNICKDANLISSKVGAKIIVMGFSVSVEEKRVRILVTNHNIRKATSNDKFFWKAYERGSKLAQSSLDKLPPGFAVDCAGLDGVSTPIVDAKVSEFAWVWNDGGAGGAGVRLIL